MKFSLDYEEAKTFGLGLVAKGLVVGIERGIDIHGRRGFRVRLVPRKVEHRQGSELRMEILTDDRGRVTIAPMVTVDFIAHDWDAATVVAVHDYLRSIIHGAVDVSKKNMTARRTLIQGTLDCSPEHVIKVRSYLNSMGAVSIST